MKAWDVSWKAAEFDDEDKNKATCLRIKNHKFSFKIIFNVQCRKFFIISDRIWKKIGRKMAFLSCFVDKHCLDYFSSL